VKGRDLAFAVFALVAIFGIFLWSSSHEEAHKQIYLGMCTNATVAIHNNFWDMMFHGGNSFMDTELMSGYDCDPNTNLAQSINEAIGYQIGPLLALSFALLAGIFAFMLMGDD
jgi:hypothetical protein